MEFFKVMIYCLENLYFVNYCSSCAEDSKVLTTTAPSGEGCPYKGLTPQEMKQLKQAIVDQNSETFDTLVQSNPRFVLQYLLNVSCLTDKLV